MQECVFKDFYSLSLDNKKKLESFFLSSKFKEGKTKKYSEIKKKIINYFKNETVSKKINISKFSEKIIIYTFIYNDNFFKCYLSVKNRNLISCNEIDVKNYSKLISESGRYQLSNNFKSFPINLGTLNNEIQIIKLAGNAKEFYIDKNATYHYVAVNKKNQKLKFIFKNNKSKLFIQGNFKDVNFDFKKEFNSTEIKKENARYDKNLLTGCVNFYNTNFNNVSLKSSNMNCEDSINIKNSKGVIENIEINNSLYDGLDIDFSKLKIDNIVVNNAQNDCLDFSFGEYDINHISLSNCADKGASVGERSKLNLNEGYITKSNIGIASKDDASTHINKIKIEKVDTCLAAYNKKREFKGSTINVNYFSCNSFNTKKKFDDQSKILISNEY